MWKNLRFSESFNNPSVLFLDVMRTEERSSIHSWTNRDQVKATIEIFNVLQPVIQGKIVILCYYKSTVQYIQKLDLSIPVYTVESYFGKGERPNNSSHNKDQNYEPNYKCNFFYRSIANDSGTN